MAETYVSSTTDRTGTLLFVRCTIDEPGTWGVFRAAGTTLGLTYMGLAMPIFKRGGVAIPIRPVGPVVRLVTGSVITIDHVYSIDPATRIAFGGTAMTVEWAAVLGSDGTNPTSPATQSATTVTNGSWVDTSGWVEPNIDRWDYLALGVTPTSPATVFAAGNLRLWVDADECTSANGADILSGELADKSGNAYTLNAPTAGQRPTFNNGASSQAIGGKGVASYDHTASDRSRITGGIGIDANSEPVAVFMTVRLGNQVSGTRELVYHNNGSGAAENRYIQAIFQSTLGGALTATPGTDWGDGTTPWVNFGYAVGEAFTVGYISDGAATSNISLWVNGIKITTTAQSRRNAAADGFWELMRASGDLAEVVIGQEALTDTQARQIMAGMMQRRSILGRIVYLDNVGGSNSNANTDGSGNAVQTLAHALTRTRTSMPDWLLVKRGTTEAIASGITSRFLSIRAAEVAFPYCAFIGTYDTGDRPVLNPANNITLFDTDNRRMENIVIAGLNIWHKERDPAEGSFVGNNVATNGVGINLGGSNSFDQAVIEDCKFRSQREGITVQNGGGGATDRQFFVNRCIFDEQYDPRTETSGSPTSAVRGMGVYIHNNTGIAQFADSIFWHCGWSEHTNVYGAGRADTTYKSIAIVQNHGIYTESTQTLAPTASIGCAFLRCAAQGRTNYSGGWDFHGVFKDNGIGHGARGGESQTHSCLSYRNFMGQGRDVEGTGQNMGINAVGAVLTQLLENTFSAPVSAVVGTGQGANFAYDVAFTLARRDHMARCVAWNRVGNPVQTSDNASFDTTARLESNLFVQPAASVGTRLALVGLAASADLTWARNRYFSSGADTGSWFSVNGSNRTFLQFTGDFSDATSVKLSAAPAVVAGGRTINDFAVSLGLANEQAWIDEQRTRARGTWTESRSPRACEKYIRGGLAPAAPAGLAVTAGGGNDLAWDAHAAVAANWIHGDAPYRVYRGTTSNGSDAVLIAEVATNSYNDATGDGTHYYAVTAMAEWGVESDFSGWEQQDAGGGGTVESGRGYGGRGARVSLRGRRVA